MELPVFQWHASCTSCELHASATNVGIPTRSLHNITVRKPKALLVIGAHPGIEEDAACAAFVGAAGAILKEVYVETTGLEQYADVYVTNAVRCKPPKDADPRPKHYHACKQHIVADLEQLRKHYENITIFGVGAGAARSLLSSSLDSALGKQGVKVDFGGGHSYPAFWTDNPANLLTHRNPTRLDAVTDHLSLLRDYLRYNELPLSTEALACTPESATRLLGIPTGGVISVDIESYGAVAGLPQQRVFNATRAIRTDGCPPGQLVQTIAIAWRDKGTLRSATYVASNPEHRDAFAYVMGQCPAHPLHFLGMNTQFDVGFLRADPRFSGLITRGKFKLLDLGVYNYLHSEIRTERSLKTISPLMGVGDYHDELNLKKGERYDTDTDERLLKYNAKDAIYTLLGYERLLARIADDYGADSDKLSDRTRDWYSELLWFAVESGESGVSIDRRSLELLAAKLQRGSDAIRGVVQSRFGGSISGKGSRKWRESLTEAAATESGLISTADSGTRKAVARRAYIQHGGRRIDRRLRVTPKTKVVAADNENFELLLGNLPRTSPYAQQIKMLQNFTLLRDTVSRYTAPMLRGRKVKGYKGLHPGSLIIDDAVYPNWYVVPGQFEDGGTGGTKQGRITCRNPGLLNLAKTVKKRLWTRFSPGVLLESDLSQIELRVAALISGCPVMMGDYIKGTDRHLKTARVMMDEIVQYMKTQGRGEAFGIKREFAESLAYDPSITKKSPGVDIWRQLGKTMNFLIVYRGGAKRAQETAQKDQGVLLPLDVWERIINRFRVECPVFEAWQQQWIADACKYGKCVLPLLGQSRLFLGGTSGVMEQAKEVVNFPIQTTAANVMIDGQRMVRQRFRELQMDSVSNLSIYDAMYTESPAAEVDDAKRIIAECLSAPDYWKQLESHYGRTMPCGFETKVLCER